MVVGLQFTEMRHTIREIFKKEKYKLNRVFIFLITVRTKYFKNQIQKTRKRLTDRLRLKSIKVAIMSDHSKNQNLMEKAGSIIKELFMMEIGCKGKDKAKVNNTLYNLTIVFKVSIQMV